MSRARAITAITVLLPLLPVLGLLLAPAPPDIDHPDVASADAFLSAIQGLDGFVDSELHVRRFDAGDGAILTAAWVTRDGVSSAAGHAG